MSEVRGEAYVVAGNKPWNRRVFDEVIGKLPGTWDFVASPPELTAGLLDRVRPRYVFFLHWSHKVTAELLGRTECVCFHMADVPYGRGGSPLQNLIAAGHRSTVLTALRMVEEMDAGPVYFKEPLSLEGNAEEIYIRATHAAAGMIKRIIAERPQPVPQVGEPTVFRRRKPADTAVPAGLSALDGLYDFIRMLDAQGYPRAFLTHGAFRYEFSRVALYDGRLLADVTITPVKEGGE